MLTWTLRPWQRALIARLEVPPGLIREIKPEAGLSRTCDHLAIGLDAASTARTRIPQNREAFARILANVRKHAPAIEHAAARAHLPQPVKQPKHHQSGGDDRGACKPLGFVAIQPDKLSSTSRRCCSRRRDHRHASSAPPCRTPISARRKPRLSRSSPRASSTRGPRISAQCSGLNTWCCSSVSPQEVLASMPGTCKDSTFSYAVDVPKLVETVKALI